MKVKYHIPTEQFGFMEIEGELGLGDVPTTIQSYDDVRASVMPKTASGAGLDDKEWRTALDGYLTVGIIPSDVYERMNPEQQRVMQEIKKAFKRINPPEERT